VLSQVSERLRTRDPVDGQLVGSLEPLDRLLGQRAIQTVDRAGRIACSL
jgi:hypothetical protein